MGFMELFVNQNYQGKRLTIGVQEFARGYWAHAPSVMVFPLDGKYEWFETSFGLDGLAIQSGSSEFVIAESLADVSQQHLDARIRPLLWRDFPGRPVRHEIEREMADGIWEGLGPGTASSEDVLCARYRDAIMRTFPLPMIEAGSLPSGVEPLRALYHEAKQLAESWQQLRKFRGDVEPQPTFDPPVLTMQHSLDQLEPSSGGASYLTRLTPVREQVRAALSDDAARRPGACCGGGRCRRCAGSFSR